MTVSAPVPDGNRIHQLGAKVRRVFSMLAENEPYAVLLESAGGPEALTRWSLMGLRPRRVVRLEGEVLTVDGLPEVMSSQGELFERLRSLFQEARYWPDSGLPFTGGWMGYFGYEFSRWCEPALWNIPDMSPEEVRFPDLLLCEFEDWLVADLESGQLHVLSEDPERASIYLNHWAEEPNEAAHAPQLTQSLGVSGDALSGFTPSISPEDFEAAVDRIKDRIAQGELYQANLSFRLRKPMRLQPYRLYDALSRRNPSPFSGIFQWPDGMILCNSPERLVQVDALGQVQSRPIAGTRGRGKSEAEDLRIGETLLSDEKERAEHLMLVDLQRNDLGRVCRPGTVAVDELLVLERYSHVTHLVSNVTGALREDKDGFDVLQALFPGGTITGCPKIRCIQTLHQEEPVPRGPYTGSLGYFDRGSGALDLNILIRSVFLSRPTVCEIATKNASFVYNTAIHVGAGIVADSVGAYEYRECLRKAAAILGELKRHESNQKLVRV